MSETPRDAGVTTQRGNSENRSRPSGSARSEKTGKEYSISESQKGLHAFPERLLVIATLLRPNPTGVNRRRQDSTDWENNDADKRSYYPISPIEIRGQTCRTSYGRSNTPPEVILAINALNPLTKIHVCHQFTERLSQPQNPEHASRQL